MQENYKPVSFEVSFLLQLSRDMERLRKENQGLQGAMQQERDAVMSLEGLLAESRHQAVVSELQNKELQGEVERMNIRVEDLQIKL